MPSGIETPAGEVAAKGAAAGAAVAGVSIARVLPSVRPKEKRLGGESPPLSRRLVTSAAASGLQLCAQTATPAGAVRKVGCLWRAGDRVEIQSIKELSQP